MATISHTSNLSNNKSAKTKKVFAFIICLLVPLAIGAISGIITADEVTGWWFVTLNKPVFNPPNNVFGPVWTILYTLMGITLFMVWRSPKTPLRKKALIVFGLQLVLNFLWSILFFALHLLFTSIIDILIMWGLVLYMIILFRRTKPTAGYLNIPYLLWVSFATALNIAIWALNNPIID